ncbi:hypothetical protein BDV39DRAFT_145586 [Aspergillus sergii]|uniref:Uncharacterized protein n=1 Tax=Aspergillus sergii TaxID=1034303 RepID=A0A5N6WQ15_9EURO|nr:hypothetical protein BDV39DRAFT_145586 [Aspergillus sergii]
MCNLEETSQVDRSPFKETYENTIIRAASYHRHDYDLAIIKANPFDHEQVRSSIIRTTRGPSVNLGQPECLPLGLSLEICLLLDIESLFRHNKW